MEFPDTSATLHILENGLHVILDADSSAPVISTQAWVETGSIHEGALQGAGVSHLLEHMVFKGTKSFSSEELSLSVQAAGGQWNAYTTFERTVYYIDGPATSRELFLKAVTEMVFFPSFPKEEFEKEKDVIRREIDMGLDDPDNRASRLMFSTVFSEDSRKHPVIGHLELFNQVTYQDMLDYHTGRYTPDTVFLSISGDFQKEEILKELEELTKDIPRAFTKQADIQHQPKQLGLRERAASYAVAASKFNLCWTTPGIHHKDSAPLDLLSTILGGGHSSRLYQNLREKQNLCLHIGAWSWLSTAPTGLFAISAEVEPDEKQTLHEAILHELSSLKKELETDLSSIQSELNKAKRMCLSSQFRTLNSASGRATDLASNWHEARDLNFTKNYLETVQSVEPADILRVLQSHLMGKNNLTLITLNPEDHEETKTQRHTPKRSRELIEHTLSNGMRLLLCQDHKIPTVSIQTVSQGGLIAETPEVAGISTLHSTLLTKGTQRRSGQEIADTLESLGASIGASAGNNTVMLGSSCLSPDLAEVLQIHGETLAQPAFEQAIIDYEKEVQLTALKEEEQDPLSLAFRKLKSELYAKEGYGIPRLGTELSLQSIDQNTLLEYHQCCMGASHSVSAIFGSIDPSEVIDLAEKTLAATPAGAPLSAFQQTITPPSEHALHLPKQQAVLTLGYPGADLNSEHRFALDLLQDWFSDMAGPLFSKIREELGLAYYVSSTQFRGLSSGFFGFYLGTSPEQLKQARTALQETIHTICQQGMPESILASVKTSWLAKQALTNQSHAAMARLCSIDYLFGFEPENYKQTAKAIEKVTTQDILAAARHYLAEQTPTVVTVSPQ